MEGSFYERVAALRAAIKVTKGNWNDFDKFNYRTLTDELDVINPIIQDYGVLLTFNQELVFNDGNFHQKCTASLLDVSSDLKLDSSAYVQEIIGKNKNSAQLSGAVTSYGRRYALEGLFCLDSGEEKIDQTEASALAAIENCTDLNYLENEFKPWLQSQSEDLKSKLAKPMQAKIKELKKND